MQPAKSSVTGLFNMATQYVVPVFQRGYVWTLEKQVAPLWSDVADRADAGTSHKQLLLSSPNADVKSVRKHFLGSLVLSPIKNDFGRVPAFEVIDGQQRTTTLHLLVLAFYRFAEKHDQKVLKSQLEILRNNPSTYTIATDIHKVWPTQAGREEIAFLDATSDIKEICKKYPVKVDKKKVARPLLVEAYLYLYHAIEAYVAGIDLNDADPEGRDTTLSDLLVHRIRHEPFVRSLVDGQSMDQNRGESLFMALNDHMQIMTLTLDTEDDPQVIFETLNARGEPLLASDLIRNFVFLDVARRDKPVGELYSRYWKDFDEHEAPNKKVSADKYWREKERQGRINYPRIDAFFFHYVIMRRVSETKIGAIFQSFKDWWQQKKLQPEDELKTIQATSLDYRALVTPTGTDALSEFARILKAMDVSTFIPVCLFLQGKLSSGDSEKRQEIMQAFNDLESYVVRRAICGITTKNYNRIALRLLEVLSKADNYAASVRAHLLGLGGETGSWPTDENFERDWLYRPVYKDMKQLKTRAVLRRLELAMRGPKQEDRGVPEDLTLEHVLPLAWKNSGYYEMADASPDAEAARNSIIHTFGNLTLMTQGLNSSTSNGPFNQVIGEGGKLIEGKRVKIAENSLLLMNSYFQKLEGTEWNETAIKARGRILFETAKAVWPRPESA